jgi:hypothetical protein
MKWLIALLLLAPLVQGISLGTDNSGDVYYETLGQNTGIKDSPSIDFLESWFEESEETLTVGVEVLQLDGESNENFLTDFDELFVNFTYDGARYSVTFARFSLYPIEDGSIVQSALYRVRAGGADYLTELDFTTEENRYKATVPRDKIQDEFGAPMRVEHLITDFTIESVNQLTVQMDDEYTQLFSASDKLETSVEWELIYGVIQTGSVLLDSDRPVRVSNGEATTFLYELSARNEGDTLERFQLSTENVPETWTVTLPDQVIAVEAGQKLDFPVLVTVPFRHEHGILEQLTLKATSQTNPENVGAMELGVRYTDTPQPAGHHNQLYIHSLDQFQAGIMNTNSEIVNEGGNIESRSSCSCGGEYIRRITARLSPSLEMGLDFDMDARGAIEIPVFFDDELGEVALDGFLAVLQPNERLSFFDESPSIVAEIARTATMAGSPDPILFESTITPTAFGDYWPYEQDAQLVMVLDLYLSGPATEVICCFDFSNAEVIPGGMLTLPLNEYHDDVSSYFTSLSGLNVLAVTSQKQSVNPGETAVFEFDVENTGSGNGNYELSLTGEPIEWAELLGATEISVPGKDIRRVAVAIHAPADATDGAQADITLHAVSSKDPNTRSLVRVLATVDSAADLPDQAARASELAGELQEEAPFAFILPILAIALVFRHNR